MPFSRATREKIAERQRIRKNRERAARRRREEKAEKKKLEIDELRDRASELIKRAFALEVPDSVGEKEI